MKIQIRGEFLKIQGQATKAFQALRISLMASNQSSSKILGLNEEIENAKNEKDSLNIDYRKLYKDVENCLKMQNENFHKEYKGVAEKIQGWSESMDSLVEQIDCDLITKKNLKEMHNEIDRLKHDVERREEEKKTMMNEIIIFKSKSNDNKFII